MRKFGVLLTIIIALLPAFSCHAHRNHKVIETFQVVSTYWDQILYDEIRREAFFHEDFDFRFNIAKDAEEEVLQIERAISKGVDAIIVNPFKVETVQSAIDKAYEAGIAVVLVGQKGPSYKYNAYIGPDNLALGRAAARFICRQFPNGGNLIMIGANIDEPYYQQRREGFTHAIRHCNKINIVGSINADWDKCKAHHMLDSLSMILEDTQVDVIYAFGDDMINGAIESSVYQNAKYVGGDGISRDGLKYMENGTLTASFINSTGGEDAVTLATSILNGEKYEKNNYLNTILLTADQYKNYSLLRSKIRSLEHRIDLSEQHEKEHIRKKHLVLSVLYSLLFIMALMSVAGLVIRKNNVKERREKKDLENSLKDLREKYLALHVQNEINEQTKVQLLSERELMMNVAMSGKEKEETADPVAEAVFVKQFREFVSGNLDHTELSVDTIASELGVSRAQLFRRIKEDTGTTPNELIQSLRLDKANTLLRTTDKTISEIAYEVGFSSPSFFSKCYKDRFGSNPNAGRNGKSGE